MTSSCMKMWGGGEEGAPRDASRHQVIGIPLSRCTARTGVPLPSFTTAATGVHGNPEYKLRGPTRRIFHRRV